MTTPQRQPPTPTIDLLLNLIDTRPASILTTLQSHPSLATAADSHGYTLVHASASYAQLDVLRTLITTYNANVNVLDEDGETALFACEKLEVAQCLVEELGADWRVRNGEGKTAEEKIGEEEGEAVEVVQYLRSVRDAADGGEGGSGENALVNGGAPPPPLPNGVKVNVGSMEEEDAGDAPDPEIRRRIEELAARDDFQTEEGQRQLRELVLEVVTGIGAEQADRSVRRRMD